uniref:Methylosome subunit pICln n=1 Tax=Setaria digitata TaxID=48799 RepID=A0A915PW23_9BILA
MIVLSNVAAPTDGIRLAQGQVIAYIESESVGEGELTVAESSVTWISSISGQGFSLTYPSIILHAISRDPSVFPEECIYVLADAKRSDIGIQTIEESVSSAQNITGNGTEEQTEFSEESEENGHDHDDDDDDKAHLAIRFSPQDKSIFGLERFYKTVSSVHFSEELRLDNRVSLVKYTHVLVLWIHRFWDAEIQNIYQQMCECQGLNPDEGDDFSDEFTMDPDSEFLEGRSDEEDDERHAGEGDHENILHFQNISTNMNRHETNGDRGNMSGSEQMDEG